MAPTTLRAVILAPLARQLPVPGFRCGAIQWRTAHRRCLAPPAVRWFEVPVSRDFEPLSQLRPAGPLHGHQSCTAGNLFLVQAGVAAETLLDVPSPSGLAAPMPVLHPQSQRPLSDRKRTDPYPVLVECDDAAPHEVVVKIADMLEEQRSLLGGTSPLQPSNQDD